MHVLVQAHGVISHGHAYIDRLDQNGKPHDLHVACIARGGRLSGQSSSRVVCALPPDDRTTWLLHRFAYDTKHDYMLC